MTDKEAMKLALEALERLTGAWQTFDALDYGDNAITALKERLAQPEQEPVAEVIDWGIEGPRLKGLTEDWPRVGTKLYTTPPQRTEQSGWRKKQIDDAEEELEKKNEMD